MGREAVVYAEVGGQAGEAKALLEGNELILRGKMRRRYPRSLIKDVRVEGDVLLFSCSGEAVRLRLGIRSAEAWCRTILTPPPDLRSKLGITHGVHALLVGRTDDLELCQALVGSTVDEVASAGMIVACVDEASDLEAALAAHNGKPSLPLWVVYRKGRGVAFGDGAIRTTLRSQGFRDTKSCAVSDVYTATRYNPL